VRTRVAGLNISRYRAYVAKREPRGEDPAPRVVRLPRGRHGLPRELVAENQRQRLIGGVIEAVAKNGYAATTVADITGAAKLSRRTFYQQFANKDDCFAAAYEETLEYLRQSMQSAIDTQSEWPQRVRERLGALLDVLSRYPALARCLLIAPAAAGGEIAERHHQAMCELVALLTEGAPPSASTEQVPGVREQALAGGISRLIVRKLSAGESAELPSLAATLVELVLRPYLGGDEAARVARGMP
jgi:AcrR family transcriptional regulator